MKLNIWSIMYIIYVENGNKNCFFGIKLRELIAIFLISIIFFLSRSCMNNLKILSAFSFGNEYINGNFDRQSDSSKNLHLTQLEVSDFWYLIPAIRCVKIKQIFQMLLSCCGIDQKIILVVYLFRKTWLRSTKWLTLSRNYGRLDSKICARTK